MKLLRFHPMFFLFMLVMIALGEGQIFVVYMLVVLLHEMAHGAVAKKIGYSLNKIYLLPFGAMLDINQSFLAPEDEVKIAVAGPLFNFVVCLIFIAVWWMFPITYAYTDMFVMCNFITGIINLLPCYPMDGGRILVAALSKKLSRKKALNICYLFNYLFSLIFVILFFVRLKTEVNLTFALMAIFIFFGTINNKFSGNYSIFNFKKKNEISHVNSISASSEADIFKIYKNLNSKKFNIIYVIYPNGNVKVITENKFLQLIEKNKISAKIGELI